MNPDLRGRLDQLREAAELDASAVVALALEKGSSVVDTDFASRWPQYAEFLQYSDGARFGHFVFNSYRDRNTNPLATTVWGRSTDWLDAGLWLYDLLGIQASTNQVVRYETSADYYEPGNDLELGEFDSLLSRILSAEYATLVGDYMPDLNADPFWVLLGRVGLRK